VVPASAEIRALYFIKLALFGLLPVPGYSAVLVVSYHGYGYALPVLISIPPLGIYYPIHTLRIGAWGLWERNWKWDPLPLPKFPSGTTVLYGHFLFLASMARAGLIFPSNFAGPGTKGFIILLFTCLLRECFLRVHKKPQAIAKSPRRVLSRARS
jgi:hypothetical protein